MLDARRSTDWILQIWFQNRRQNDRRKSRPLLPHEMVPHFRNSIPQELLHESNPIPHDGHNSANNSFSSVDSEHSLSSGTKECHDRNHNTSRGSSIHDLLNPVSSADNHRSAALDLQFADQRNPREDHSGGDLGTEELREAPIDHQSGPTPESPHPDRPGAGEREGDDSCDAIQKVAAVSTSSIASERTNAPVASSSMNTPKKVTVGTVVGTISSSGSECLDPRRPSRKRLFDETGEFAMPTSQSSGIRLSMKFDGAVKVKTTDEETPSPPKERPLTLVARRENGSRQCRKAISVSELVVDDDQEHRARPSGGIFGRSRDARTWEFYCDGDARASLSAQAESENNGSAVGAINLIRTQSQHTKAKAVHKVKGAALKTKEAAGFARKQPSLLPSKPSILGTTPSVAHLCSNRDLSTIQSEKIDTKIHAGSPSGDSDKENWAPGTRSSCHPLRRTKASTAASRDPLQDDLSAARSKWTRKRCVGGENEQRGCRDGDAIWQDHSEEAEGYPQVNQEGGDLDCIQGLLSLSQGSWR